MTAAEEEIRIVSASPEYLESFRECLDSVARERRWLSIVEAFPLDEIRKFIAKTSQQGGSAFFAVLGRRVVGWADCHWEGHETTRHRRVLGMAVHADYRGRGLGIRLLQTLIADAKVKGVMRLDLSVYASNSAAMGLYKKLGFVQEGRKRKSLYLDGRFDDSIQMGLIFPENLPADVASRSDKPPGT
ncbi:MAG TPA: GNAT family N-acetyltransferase [Pirellulales bacterium]|nr:GNAT family N-acetyltransferase [Pirellulales bacterium]